MDLAELDRSVEGFARGVLTTIWRHKIVFVLVSGTAFALAMLALLAVRPTYEGSTLLIAGQTGLEQQAAEGERPPPVNPAALARIAESEEVVGAAVEKVGLDRLMAGTTVNTTSLFARLRRRVFPDLAEPDPVAPPLEAALPRIKLALFVRSETNSDVIRIAFRHRDPAVAAQFANAVAQAFVDRQTALYTRAGAAEFFSRQQLRFQDEAKEAADALGQFAARTSIYDADEQKKLLLKRLNDVEAALAVTRGTIAQKVGERAILADELRKLAPVSRSQYVSGLVDTLGGDRSAAPRGPDARALDDRASDPPLLLVRVYQDSMVALFKVNAELIGVQGLQQQQAADVAKITAALNTLTDGEQEYARLKGVLDRAMYNTDVYSKRATAEQIDAESRAARLSSVKVLQRATVPLRPVSPNYIVMTLAAAFGSALLGYGAAWLRRRRRVRVVRAQAA